VRTVSQRPKLRYLCQPLGETVGLLKQWVLRRRRSVCDHCYDGQARMLAGSEYQTEGARTLKPRVVRTRETDGTTDCCWRRGA